MKRLLLCLAFWAATACAADISGKWKGTADTPNGPIERTFVFQVEGNQVTGETTSQFSGKSAIRDGRLEGDTVTFHITVNFQGNEAKLNYTGKISGDSIKFKVEAEGGGFSLEYEAKRVRD